MFSGIGALFAGLLGGGLLGGLFGGKQPKMPTPPPTPQVDEARENALSDRERRRRAAQLGRASTFLSGGVNDLGTVQRASDLLNPYGSR